MPSVVLLCAAAGLAQTPPVLVSPKLAVTLAGNGVPAPAPFVASTGVYQQVHDPESFQPPIPWLVRAMRLRMKTGFTTSKTYSADLEVAFGLSPNASPALDKVFANNVRQGTEVVAFARKVVSFPPNPGGVFTVGPLVLDLHRFGLAQEREHDRVCCRHGLLLSSRSFASSAAASS